MTDKIEVTYSDGEVEIFALRHGLPVDGLAYTETDEYVIFDQGRLLLSKLSVRSIVMYEDVPEPDVEGFTEEDVHTAVDAYEGDLDPLLDVLERIVDGLEKIATKDKGGVLTTTPWIKPGEIYTTKPNGTYVTWNSTSSKPCNCDTDSEESCPVHPNGYYI